MRFLHLVLSHPDSAHPTSMDAERIHDTLWAHLDPRSGIEHMRIRPRPDGLDVGLFFRGNPADHSDQIRDAVVRLLSCVPGWTAAPPR
ncbi:hypothetical protein ACFVVU_18575 [Kitasatospora sp. NPDC057965]|uniref:hypothetical protein n=1 Tax=unclassified Kitasatospora TaxID=2633591 RepID=UPI00367E554B